MAMPECPVEIGGQFKNERLRKENRMLREEREAPKKAAQFFAAQKP